ncbi:hypothetical protein TL16_g09258 [Triparma laevis f. inornata]|uniref:FMN-dependent dehydrogenase domain-containing protein n=1 Tax=Triparma laevis f. inornata TaxID=1714386 RepID=A0A9W7B5I1_9STRA|nr:hypothetical protein TL16_g09258 [Triparma laevis f. inornata]
MRAHPRSARPPLLSLKKTPTKYFLTPRPNPTGGFQALALTVDFTWYGNRERDIRNGFTIPPNYTPKQVWEAIKAPAWSWDFLANPAYNYACINTEVRVIKG